MKHKKHKKEKSLSRNQICATAIAIIVGIISGVFSTFICNVYIQKQALSVAHDELIYNLEHIYPGCNKEWMDDKFGKAVFSYEADEWDGYVYLTDIAIVNGLFNDNGSCDAFFVTRTSKKAKDKFSLTEPYSSFVSEKPLGAFSYYEILNTPSSVDGYCSNGTSRMAYWEDYYFMSGGNYQEFVFLTLDYGYPFISDFVLKPHEGEPLDDEELRYSTMGNYDYFMMERDRSVSRPNSYGIVGREIDAARVSELVVSYNYFDSLPLRDMTEHYQATLAEDNNLQ